MKEILEQTPARRGTYLYAGTVPCEVRIVPWHTLYGSGDAGDAPEVAEDRVVPSFHIFYRTPAGTPAWVGGGATLTLEEAVAQSEAVCGQGLRWQP